ncbi:MAG: hypothetical protein NUV70_06445 [Caldiserica bacterium]|jgi:uncharacterized membrane protein YagU involved in acid resistance|nr:hypothetical protein [Caldisericota bacterium]
MESKNVEFFQNLSREKFNFLMDSIDKLDQKFTTLFSVNAVIISVIFSLNRFQQNTLFFIGLSFFIVTLIIAVLGYVPKTFLDIDIEKFWDENYGGKYKDTIAEITSHIIAAYTKNRKVQDKKSEYVRLAFTFSLTGILLIILGQIICV